MTSKSLPLPPGSAGRAPSPVDAAYLRALGEALRRRRREQRTSRRELARKSGVSERFLADIESGRANPSILRLEHVARALGTRAAALLDGIDDGERIVITLLGLRGAGKSTIGRRLADRLGIRFVELDEDVERRMGLSLTEIFEVHGEAAYRRVEREVLRERLDAGEPLVLATGGGIVTDVETWELLRARTHTVWLRARPEDHWDRVVAQGDTRPMSGDARAFANLQAILASRVDLYAQAAQVVDTSTNGIEAVSSSIEAAVRDATFDRNEPRQDVRAEDAREREEA
ncbi:MAG: helix-turn-helix domain-containing protein [Planctomycetes bacterium]|nr:helix-turn-helix domain-containing protein [Planctomycetota bacterium]